MDTVFDVLVAVVLVLVFYFLIEVVQVADAVDQLMPPWGPHPDVLR